MKNLDRKWLWDESYSHDGSRGHPIDVEDVENAFYCPDCQKVDTDDTHWEDGDHLHDAE